MTVKWPRTHPFASCEPNRWRGWQSISILYRSAIKNAHIEPDIKINRAYESNIYGAASHFHIRRSAAHLPPINVELRVDQRIPQTTNVVLRSAHAVIIILGRYTLLVVDSVLCKRFGGCWACLLWCERMATYLPTGSIRFFCILFKAANRFQISRTQEDKPPLYWVAPKIMLTLSYIHLLIASHLKNNTFNLFFLLSIKEVFCSLNKDIACIAWIIHFKNHISK